MPNQFATQEWLQAVKLALNRSVSFREAARNWRSECIWGVAGAPRAAQEQVNVIASIKTEWLA